MNTSDEYPDLPEVDETAAARVDEELGEEDSGPGLDSAGRPWSAAQHAGTADAPERTPKGRWRRKRTEGKSISSLPNKPEDKVDGASGGGYEAAAIAIVDAIESGGVLCFGPSGRYLYIPDSKIDERAGGITAWTRYCEAKGLDSFPPEVGIALWGFSYLIVHMSTTETGQKILERIRLAFKTWLEGGRSAQGSPPA